MQQEIQMQKQKQIMGFRIHKYINKQSGYKQQNETKLKVFNKKFSIYEIESEVLKEEVFFSDILYIKSNQANEKADSYPVIYLKLHKGSVITFRMYSNQEMESLHDKFVFFIQDLAKPHDYRDIGDEEEYVICKIMEKNQVLKKIFEKFQKKIERVKLKVCLFEDQPEMIMFYQLAKQKAYEKEKVYLLEQLKQKKRKQEDEKHKLEQNQSKKMQIEGEESDEELQNYDRRAKLEGPKISLNEKQFKPEVDKGQEEEQQIFFEAIQVPKEDEISKLFNEIDVEASRQQKMQSELLKKPKRSDTILAKKIVIAETAGTSKKQDKQFVKQVIKILSQASIDQTKKKSHNYEQDQTQQKITKEDYRYFVKLCQMTYRLVEIPNTSISEINEVENALHSHIYSIDSVPKYVKKMYDSAKNKMMWWKRQRKSII